MSISPADAATLLANRETSPKTASTGPKTWLMLQPNPGGIVGFRADYDSVNRNPLSKNLTDEAGDIVGMSVSPQITHDLTLDFARFFAGDWFRCLAKYIGASGTGFFRVEAVVDGAGGEDSFTVVANGAIGNGFLVRGKGLAIAQNNAVFLTTGTPTGTAVKVATGSLAAEATAPANSTLEIVGFEAVADADVQMDANGDLTCTTTNFSNKGLMPGMEIKLGDANVANKSFAVATLNGYAEIDPTRAITATFLPLRRHSFTPAANTATGVRLRILTSAYFQNWPYGHGNHQRATAMLELETPNVGTGDVSSFRYGKGLATGMWKLNAPLKNKVTVEMSFIGMDMPDPVLQAGRPADTATALEPLDSRMFDTSSDVKYIRLARASNNAVLVDEINDWNADITLNIKPQEIQGVVGANGHIHGKFRPALNVGAYHKTDEVPKVVKSNADVYFVAVLANEDGGFCYHMPAGKLRNDEETYSESDAVMLKVDMPAHREQTGSTNRAASLTLFGYIG